MVTPGAPQAAELTINTASVVPISTGGENPEVPTITYEYSEAEKSKLQEIKNAFLTDFQVGKVYPDPASLKRNARALAEIHGFVLSQNGNKLACNRTALTEADLQKAAKKKAKNPNAKQRKRQSKRCNCAFFFTISPDRAGLPCRIVSANFAHTNGCMPGEEQLVDAQRRNGYHVRNYLNKDRLRTLIHLQQTKGFIDAPTLRPLLQQILPPNTAIDCDVLNNARLKLKRLARAHSSSSTTDAITDDVLNDMATLGDTDSPTFGDVDHASDIDNLGDVDDSSEDRGRDSESSGSETTARSRSNGPNVENEEESLRLDEDDSVSYAELKRVALEWAESASKHSNPLECLGRLMGEIYWVRGKDNDHQSQSKSCVAELLALTYRSRFVDGRQGDLVTGATPAPLRRRLPVTDTPGRSARKRLKSTAEQVRRFP